jgi:hypothetical protein
MMMNDFQQRCCAAGQQAEPQRLLFVFVRAELPESPTSDQRDRHDRREGGTLSPVLCVDKLPAEVPSFQALATESTTTGIDWDLVFVAAAGRPRRFRTQQRRSCAPAEADGQRHPRRSDRPLRRLRPWRRACSVLLSHQLQGQEEDHQHGVQPQATVSPRAATPRLGVRAVGAARQTAGMIQPV